MYTVQNATSSSSVYRSHRTIPAFISIGMHPVHVFQLHICIRPVAWPPRRPNNLLSHFSLKYLSTYIRSNADSHIWVTLSWIML